ncbi:family 16 glycosylhydrolase [Mariniluteicoccus flavus]
MLITWPDSDVWPDDAEYDFMETDLGSAGMGAFMHYGDGSAEGAHYEYRTSVGITEWHNYAFEWAPTHLAGFIDGVEWFRCTEANAQAPGPMHGTVQLDNFFGDDILNEGYLELDWYRVWDWPSGR